MAFAGMFLIALFTVLVILFFFTTIGAGCLLASFVMKRKYDKDPAGKKKTYLIPRIIGWVFMVPVIGCITLMLGATVVTTVKQHNSMAYQVMNGNVKGAERLLKKGVSPDCTLNSNSPAENGEKTLLSILCEDGFTDPTGHRLSDSDPEKELEMIELLLDYGANTETVHYFHEKDDVCHTYEDEMSVYKCDCRCGATPLLDAVYAGKTEVVEVLIAHGANVNAVDYCGFNALNVVAEYLDDSDMDMVNLLMKNDCDPGNVTNFKQSSYFLVFRRNEEEKLATLAYFFAQYAPWDEYEW